MPATKFVIYDCDNTMGLPHREIDDGLTLLYLLGRPDVCLLGVTTTFGNGAVDEAYVQTKELLARVNRPDIPVYRGQTKSGESPNEAAVFLAEAVDEMPGSISLLATGPLTNLRTAARLDERFFHNLRELACMGGYRAPLRIGWRRLPELNLSADPDAAYAVLNASCQVTLMSAQLCLQALFGWGDLAVLRSFDPWLRRIVRNWLLTFGLYCGASRFYLWDLAPAVYLSYPELFAGQTTGVVSTVNELSVGTLIAGTNQGSHGSVRLPDKICDADEFKRIVFRAWHADVKGKGSETSWMKH